MAGRVTPFRVAACCVPGVGTYPRNCAGFAAPVEDVEGRTDAFLRNGLSGSWRIASTSSTGPSVGRVVVLRAVADPWPSHTDPGTRSRTDVHAGLAFPPLLPLQEVGVVHVGDQSIVSTSVAASVPMNEVAGPHSPGIVAEPPDRTDPAPETNVAFVSGITASNARNGSSKGVHEMAERSWTHRRRRVRR